MRVLVVINGLGTGGAERSHALSTSFLRERGIETRFVTLYPRAEGAVDLLRGYERIESIEASSWIGRMRALRQLIQGHRPDLVHTVLFEATIAGRLATALERSLPVLTSLVNTTYDPGHRATVRSPAALRAYQAVDMATAGLTDHFHAVSNAVKRSAIRHLRIPESKISVIPRGRSISLTQLRTPETIRTARRRLGIYGGQPVIVTVGRQEPQKGQIYLLRAFHEALKEIPDARLYIVGREGNSSKQLKQEAKLLGLPADQIAFVGHRQDVSDYLRAADIFAFPSVYEGLGGALIEALAAGIPSVVSDIPALSEVTDSGKAAVLVPPGNTTKLATAIAQLLADRDLQGRLVQEGRRIFLSRYTLDKYADRMAALYRDVAQGRV